MSPFDDHLLVGLAWGVLLGILIDRAIIPVGEGIGDLLTLIRRRRRTRVE